VTRINTGDTVQEYTIKTETLLNFADGAFCYAQVVFSVSEEWAGVTIPGLNLTFPEAGTYVIGEIPYTITINGYNGFETTAVKPLDEKYIPDTIARVSDLEGLGGGAGIHIGTDTPSEDAVVWINPEGVATSSSDIINGVLASIPQWEGGSY
jgi:hypothetical protein